MSPLTCPSPSSAGKSLAVFIFGVPGRLVGSCVGKRLGTMRDLRNSSGDVGPDDVVGTGGKSPHISRGGHGTCGGTSGVIVAQTSWVECPGMPPISVRTPRARRGEQVTRLRPTMCLEQSHSTRRRRRALHPCSRPALHSHNPVTSGMPSGSVAGHSTQVRL